MRQIDIRWEQIAGAAEEHIRAEVAGNDHDCICRQRLRNLGQPEMDATKRFKILVIFNKVFKLTS